MPNNNNPTPNIAPLRRSQRTVHLATKVTPYFDITVRTLARDQGILITELLEKMLEAYLAQEEAKKLKIKEDKASEKFKTKAKAKK